MKTVFLPVLLLGVLGASALLAAEPPKGVVNMGNVRGGDVQHARGIIEKKCTGCHSGSVIDAAISARKDMFKIQQEMEKRGAKLSASERDVLGIYWKDQYPLKK